MARLDRFMPVKEIAQIGAAIGREFSYELIAAVAPILREQLGDSLARLTESGLAFRRGTPPDAIYTFKHALVQDAAYDSLLKSRRLELHGKIARAIEARFPNVNRSALIEQLKRALGLIATLPDTPALRQEEIKLQVALITPLLHVLRDSGI
jgi:predicted ATPase